MWVLVFVQEIIQERAIAKRKKVYSGRHTLHGVGHLVRQEAPGYEVVSFYRGA